MSGNYVEAMSDNRQVSGTIALLGLLGHDIYGRLLPVTVHNTYIIGV